MKEEPKSTNPIETSRETSNFVERRKEKRFAVPDLYRRYITLNVQSGSVNTSAVLLDFSRSGILFESLVPIAVDACADCRMSISLVLSREISFGIRVRNCQKKEDIYLIHAAIDSVADETWFSVFVEVHDFIVERRDAVY